jgi:hypothetical protein
VKKAALVTNGDSLISTLDELKNMDAKVFATPKAVPILEELGIQCQALGDPVGVTRIFGFGHKEIHLFGFDLSVSDPKATRVCYEDRVFYTTPDLALHAQMMIKACLDLCAKGAVISIHGDGMFPHMAKSVMSQVRERVLTAIYDMQVCPPTYEVFSFLGEAERFRAERGFNKIDVIFAPGPMYGFRDDGLPPGVPERVSMLNRICIPGAKLLPSVRNVHILSRRTHIEGEVFPPDWTNERPRFIYGPRFQKDANPCLHASQSARDEIKRRFPKPYSTITLRESDYWPQRNSDRKAWIKASRWLQFEQLPAVVVPDTHGEDLPGCENFTPAAWDVDLRLALYEGAKLNLGIVTGPMVLCMFSAVKPPYIMFQIPDDSPGTRESFLMEQGIKPGDRWTDNGWTIWEKDSPENVIRVLSDWKEVGMK